MGKSGVSPRVEKKFNLFGTANFVYAIKMELKRPFEIRIVAKF